MENKEARIAGMNGRAPDRMLSIDVLRGFALMGLFLIHMIEYFELYWYGSDQETGWIRSMVTTVFSGKAYTLFALLFGVTFFLLVEQNGDRSRYSPSRFAWRMLLLAAIGFAHSLIYPGDILQQLAVCGCMMLLLHRAPTWLLGLIVLLFLGKIASSIQFFVALRDDTYLQPAFWGWSQKNFEVFAHAGFWDFLKHTATTGQIPKWVLIVETGSMWTLMGYMVAGLLLARNKWFDPQQPRRIFVLTMVASVIFAVAVRLLSTHFSPYFPELMPRWSFDSVSGGLFNLAMVAFYVALFPLLLRWHAAKRVLAVLAPAGRMSLTLYVGQSVVFVPMFYGFGLGWYACIDQRGAFLLALLAWAVQLLLAHLWFQRHHHGPLEGLWRKLCLIPSKP